MRQDLDAVRITHVTDLITAIPGLLGFHPERSVVIVTVDDDGRMGLSLRHDLTMIDGQPSPAMLSKYSEVVEVVVRSQPRKVLACIVDDRYQPGAPGYLQMFASLHRHLAGCGGLTYGYAVTSIVPGAPVHGVWGDIPDHDLGCLADPDLSPVAISHTVAGYSVHRSRDEMVDELAPTPHCADPDCTYAGFSLPQWQELNLRARWIEKTTMASTAVRTITTVDPDDATCAQVTAIEEALAVLDVRDVLIGLAVTQQRDRAQQWWCSLTKRLRGPGKSTAATLLGHVQYANRDGARAGIAFEVAMTTNSANTLAQLLYSALAGGMHPREMTMLSDYARLVADECGVSLPPVDDAYDWEV